MIKGLKNEKLNDQLKRVYGEHHDYIDVLIHSGISADEFSAEKVFEDMDDLERVEWDYDGNEISKDGLNKSKYNDEMIVTTLEERRMILQSILLKY